jgi:hypothetical protein
MLDQNTFRPFATLVTQDGKTGVCIWDSRPGIRLSKKKAVEIAMGRMYLRPNYVPEVNRKVIYFDENGEVWDSDPLPLTDVVQEKIDYLEREHNLGSSKVGASTKPQKKEGFSAISRLFNMVVKT